MGVVYFSIDSEHNKETISLVQKEANEFSGEQQYRMKDIRGIQVANYNIMLVRSTHLCICAGALSIYRRSLNRKSRDSDAVTSQRLRRSRQQRVSVVITGMDTILAGQ